MTITKGYRCPSCKGKKVFKGDYKKRGHFLCRECGAIWWTIFDRPAAGRKGPGRQCSECGSKNLQLVAEMNTVKVFRCSACAFTMLEYAQKS